MNEVNEMWREVRQDQQAARAERKAKNLETLQTSTIPYETRNGGDVVLIRSKEYPAVDFWPSTNRWKVGNRKMMGTAADLVAWLKRRAI